MSNIIITFVLFSVLCASAAFAVKQSYIVYMGAHSHPLEVTQEDYDRASDYHHQFLASFVGSHEEAKNAIFYSYTKHINGFAAILEEHHAAEIRKHPEVVSVFLNQGKKLHTTHSWDFMMLESDGVIYRGSSWEKARFGEDTIIGNLDTGVWPESQSFSDEVLGPIPSRWKGGCEKGCDISCNRKLIGARHFNQGYLAFGGKINASMNSARDYDGHGSHTLSTAGGSFVPDASIFGIANGTAKGGSPRARVAAYKVCWPPVNGSECFDADIIAAFDMAIHDGVDVLSVSLGGEPTQYFNDGMAIGSFHAIQRGIVVVCSAGNSGPTPSTVTNVAPWLITVGASTVDREFQTFVELGNGKRLKGKSLSEHLPEHRLYPLSSGAQAKAANASAFDAMLCKPGTLDHTKVKGKILACLRGDNSRVDKGMQAKLAGAVGMILCNAESDANEIIADLHVLPAAHLTYTDAVTVLAYINSTDKPVGFITDPTAKLNTKPAPYMAAFSSQGPNSVTPEILKPDITAPGVDIIAAYSEAVSPTEESFDKRRVPYMVDSGTSMSCPHISGVVGLLKTLHPDWSPAAIRSAIMTSARTRDNTVHPMKDAAYVEAHPFNFGAGHVRPTRAMDPGLVYDMTTTDYLDFLCALGYNKTLIRGFRAMYDGSYKCPDSSSPKSSILNLNYPSITVPRLSGSVTVSRTLKNVGSPGTYAVTVRQPRGVSVTVEPKMIKFDKVGEESSFNVTLEVKCGMSQNYVFGHLMWSDGKHHVRSPIVVAAAAWPSPARQLSLQN